jgi:hypothetical protein
MKITKGLLEETETIEYPVTTKILIVSVFSAGLLHAMKICITALLDEEGYRNVLQSAAFEIYEAAKKQIQKQKIVKAKPTKAQIAKVQQAHHE